MMYGCNGCTKPYNAIQIFSDDYCHLYKLVNECSFRGNLALLHWRRHSNKRSLTKSSYLTPNNLMRVSIRGETESLRKFEAQVTRFLTLRDYDKKRGEFVIFYWRQGSYCAPFRSASVEPRELASLFQIQTVWRESQERILVDLLTGFKLQVICILHLHTSCISLLFECEQVIDSLLLQVIRTVPYPLQAWQKHEGYSPWWATKWWCKFSSVQAHSGIIQQLYRHLAFSPFSGGASHAALTSTGFIQTIRLRLPIMWTARVIFLVLAISFAIFRFKVPKEPFLNFVCRSVDCAPTFWNFFSLTSSRNAPSMPSYVP